MPSATFELFREAIFNEKQVLCTYGGYHRELCPHILGRSNGEEKVLTFQFAGQSRTGLPPGGEWRCLYLSQVRDARLRDGPWHAGGQHRTAQRCVIDVEVDINIHVRRQR